MSGQGEPPPVALARLLEQGNAARNQLSHQQIRRGPSQPSQLHQQQSWQQQQYQHQHQNQQHHHQQQQQQHHQQNYRSNYQQQNPQYQGNRSQQRQYEYNNHPGQQRSYSQNAFNQNRTSNGQIQQQHQFSQNQGSYRNRQQRGQFNNARSAEAQETYLEQLIKEELPKVMATQEEIDEKYHFLRQLELRAQKQFAVNFVTESMFYLVPYGSIESGFASKGSDVDCVVVWDKTRPAPSDEERDALPRLLEHVVLQNNWGGRLLTNTRVPILKVCGAPSPELLDLLRQERVKWETRPPTPPPDNSESLDQQSAEDVIVTKLANASINDSTAEPKAKLETEPQPESELEPTKESDSELKADQITDTKESGPAPTRILKARGPSPLDYPSSASPLVDINFSMELGILNTKLLRCYSVCDSRVGQMVHFIKSWSKKHQLASPYTGTLCSYGWVLMILHYLINIAHPPVLPNLQLDFPRQPLPINGTDVGFFDNPNELSQLVQQGMLFGGKTGNTQSIGSLVKGFFHYYAHQGNRAPNGGFRWREDVICLRVQGGLVKKESKGWTSSSSTKMHGVEVKQRYLMAIECPIEVNHNVARTVVHRGIVEMRDTLRRVWSVIENVGFGRHVSPGQGLMDYQQVEVKVHQNPHNSQNSSNVQNTPSSPNAQHT